MKKIVLVLFSMMFFTALLFAQTADDLFISEYIEGSSSNKALEIFNGTGAPVDLSGYVLERCNNGDVWGDGILFTFAPGTWIVADGDVWVNVNSDAMAGMKAVADSIGGGLTWFNGDDSIGLFKIVGTDTLLIDVIGENGVDPGIAWDVAGVTGATGEHTLVRKSTVTSGNTDWAASAGTNATDSEWIVYPQDNYDDLGSHTMGGNVLPLITNIVRTPAGDVTSSTTVSISADVTDSDGTISLVELHWGLVSGSLTTTINMSNFGGDTYTTNSDIPAQLDLTTVYYEIYAEDNVPESSTSAEQSYTVFDAQSTTLPYTEPFDADLGLCYTYNDSGASKEWYWNSGGFAAMNGHNSGETEVDWLVLPAIDFDSYANETMTFDTWYNYGTDNATNYLKLYYSADYPGLGDPNGSSWTELSFTMPAGFSTWTSSGSIDLSAVSGTSVYLAFKYRYEVGLYRMWYVDNISIIEGNPPLVADFEADQTNVEPGTTVNFTDLTTGGATPYTSWEWDLDGDGEFDDAFIQNPSFLYSTIGTYDVSLRVTDDESTVDVETKLDYITVAEIVTGIIINEVDSDTPGTDVLEFIELYDGGVGNTPLDGYVVVLYNGSNDLSYNAFDLDTYSTDANGYFLLGNASVVPTPSIIFGSNGLQNGADAVALYTDDATNFPNGTGVTTTNLIDAIVYDTNDPDDPALLVLLNPGQPQVNEDGKGDKDHHSNQRIPNGSGGARNTDTYTQGLPTPGAENQVQAPIPQNVTIQINGNDIVLTWSPGAKSIYNVYRCIDPYGTFVKINTS
ncbi:MAG: lamin tail domain-containing protein, partial [Candidatus Cloacimonetes bacterium]|nr:lamin tail domain-containing protein [Candidatus Cloacimonadota bacterium]